MEHDERHPAADEPVPPETPEGTAAERPGRERTSMDQEPPAAEDPLLREQEEAAAQEADAFPAEEESDRSDAVYAEPDEVDPTEVVRDPREGRDDPGAGPGLAPE